LPWLELGVAGLTPVPGPVTAASLLQLQLWGGPAGERGDTPQISHCLANHILFSAGAGGG